MGIVTKKTMQQIILPQPSTLNEMISKARASKYGAASDKKKWTVKIAKLALKEKLEPLESQGWIIPTFTYYSTASDPDNLYATMKYIQDGLVMAGVIQNDTVKLLKPPYVFDVLQIPRKTQKYVIVNLYSSHTEWQQDTIKLIMRGNDEN